MVVHELSHAGFLIQENGRSGELRIVVHGLHQVIFRNGLWYISSQLPPQYMQSQLNEELTAHLASWTSRRTCAQVAPLLRNLRFASLPPTTSPGKHTMLPTGHAMATDSHYDLSDDMT